MSYEQCVSYDDCPSAGMYDDCSYEHWEVFPCPNMKKGDSDE